MTSAMCIEEEKVQTPVHIKMTCTQFLPLRGRGRDNGRVKVADKPQYQLLFTSHNVTAALMRPHALQGRTQRVGRCQKGAIPHSEKNQSDILF